MNAAPRVDPHIHLWAPRENARQVRTPVRLLGWNRGLLDAVAKLAFPKDLLAFFSEKHHVFEDYLPSDHLAPATGIERVVHIQAGWNDARPLDPVGETQWLESLRRAGAPIAGIVAYADLRLGAAVGEVLDAHLAASPAIRGVRYMLAHHEHPWIHSFAPAPGLSADPSWRRGFEELARRDLSFDAWVYHQQLPELAALARDYPETRIVLCHAGTPAGVAGSFHGLGASESARERIRAEWRDGLAELAECDNVHCKLSGLAMPILGFGFHERRDKPGVDELATALEPLVRGALAAFGVERCMFGSNFPVDLVAVDLDTLYLAFERIATALGVEDGDRPRLFHDNAASFYRLDP